MHMLQQVTVFLLTAVLLVPLFRRFGLGAVLGYLAAGMLIGPSGLKLVGDLEATRELAEFGVVLLLFVIGLELEPSRLWVLRRAVFGLGAAQVLVTTAVLGTAAAARLPAPRGDARTPERRLPGQNHVGSSDRPTIRQVPCH